MNGNEDLSPLAQAVIQQASREGHPLNTKHHKKQNSENDDKRDIIGIHQEQRATHKTTIIIEMPMMGIPHYVVVKDENKSRCGFPGGKQSPTDADIFMTATRECLEETGIEAHFSSADKVGEIPSHSDDRGKHTVHVFTTHVPEDTPTFKGPEQTEIWLLTEIEIEERILNGEFLERHVEAWKMYKRYKSQ